MAHRAPLSSTDGRAIPLGVLLGRRTLLLGGVAFVCLPTAACGSRDLSKEEFDVCIVGSGFAGISLALRLVDAGLRTLVIEAGPRPGDVPENDLSPSFVATNVGEIKYSVASTRQIMLGGTSNHWGGVVMRLWENDMRLRSAFSTGADWPMSYEALRRYYCESEQALSVRGAPHVSEAEPPRSCDYPHLEPDRSALSLDILQKPRPLFPVARSNRDDEPVRLLDGEVGRFQSAWKGTLAINRQVTRIVTVDGRKVSHLETGGADGTKVDIHAKTFVLAAGSIETPRLLLLSKTEGDSDPRLTPHRDGLGNAAGLVGKHFNVHPSFERRFQARKGRSLDAGEFRTASLSDPFRESRLNGCHFHLNVAEDGLKMKWRAQPEIEARPENGVGLSTTEKDRFGNPAPEVRLNYSERDKATFEKAAQILDELEKTSANRGKKIRRYERWRAHPAGTCRMAASESDGVVNDRGQVFGLENLFLSGACTFPSSGASNPTNTVVALTLRLAEHLVELHRGT